MAKPTVLPRWADTVSADPMKLNEPPNAKKDVGWLVAEKPPAQWFNWLFFTIWQWVLWLQGFESTAHSWAALQSFDFGIIVAQATVNASAILATGQGTGYGLLANGGANGVGVRGVGHGANAGVEGAGGAAAPGVRGVGGTNGAGGVFTGDGTAAGVTAAGGAAGIGVLAQGNGSAAGVEAQGGVTNGRGVRGVGTGTGEGVRGEGGTTSQGVHGIGGATSGAGVRGESATASAGVEAVAGTGNAIDATGKIAATDDITTGVYLRAPAGSVVVGRIAHGTTAPTPALEDGEVSYGSVLWAHVSWIDDGTMTGVYLPFLRRGKGVYALTKVINGDYWVEWDITTLTLTEAKTMAYWANILGLGSANVIDADISGTGGRYRTRTQTRDAAGALITTAGITFATPG